MPLILSFIVPHPPLLLSEVGSKEKKEKVAKTLESINLLQNDVITAGIEKVTVVSPHKGWGFDVPLHFFQNNASVEKILVESDDFLSLHNQGKNYYGDVISLSSLRTLLIASGDLSHCLKEDGPYGYHSDGVSFDEEFLLNLQNNNLQQLIDINSNYPRAEQCGLGPVAFLLGVLDGYKKSTERDYRVKIISYEAPFGVGYLVAKYNL